MKKLATSPGGRPGALAAQKEDQNRLAFESGNAAFEVNYPFVYPSAKDERAQDLQEHGLGALPGVDAGQARRKATDRRHQLGRRRLHEAPDRGLRRPRPACATPQNQKVAALKGGLPPTLDALYDDPSLLKAYPFAALIRKQVSDRAPCGRSDAGLRRRLAGDLQERLAAVDAIEPERLRDDAADQARGRARTRRGSADEPRPPPAPRHDRAEPKRKKSR